MTATNFESWPIVRFNPVSRTYGRSISVFVNNWHCHVATVDVYADGAIDCWGFVDRALFAGKLQSSWVVPAPGADQLLSVFNFGHTGMSDGLWMQTTRSIAQEVESVLQSLNPEMRDLLDMHGSDTEMHGNVKYAKLGLADKKPYRKDASGGGDILGDSVPVLRTNADGFELSRLVVYADGVCQIGSAAELVPIGELSSLYDRGVICNTAPAGSKIVLYGLGEFRATTELGVISVRARIGEIEDKLDQLNGKPGIVATCVKLFEQYRQAPSPQSKQALREAYESVPEHLRRYCGNMDLRDSVIRSVLDGGGG